MLKKSDGTYYFVFDFISNFLIPCGFCFHYADRKHRVFGDVDKLINSEFTKT